MPTYARITDNTAAEIFTPPEGVPIAACFVPQLAILFTEVPDGTVAGSTLADGVWTAPPPPEPPDPPPPASRINATDWLNRFTPAEQIAVQSACLANPTIQLGLTVGLAQGWIDLAQPRAAAWLALLVTAGAIDAARVPTLLQLP